MQKIGDLYFFHRNYSWHLAYQYGYTCFYCLDPIVLTIPLLICTWFLKNQFGIIKLDVQVYFKLDFYCLFRLQKSSSSKLIFTTWFFKNKVQINRGYEQPLKFLFFGYLVFVLEILVLQSDFLQSPLLKDLQTCQSTKSQSSPDPYFFEKGYIKRLGSYLSISVRVGQNLYVSPQPYGCQILFPKINVGSWSPMVLPMMAHMVICSMVTLQSLNLAKIPLIFKLVIIRLKLTFHEP